MCEPLRFVSTKRRKIEEIVRNYPLCSLRAIDRKNLGIFVKIFDKSFVNDPTYRSRFWKEWKELKRVRPPFSMRRIPDHGYSNTHEMRQETNHCGANDVSRKWSHREGKGGTEGRHKWRGYKGRGNAISKITAYRVIDTRAWEQRAFDKWRSVRRDGEKSKSGIHSSHLSARRSTEECNYKWHCSTCSIDQLFMFQRDFGIPRSILGAEEWTESLIERRDSLNFENV